MHPVLRVLRKAAEDMVVAVGVLIVLAVGIALIVANHYAHGALGGITAVTCVAVTAWQNRQKKKEEAKARALADVQDAVTAFAAVQGDEVRSARAKTKLHAAIRNANNVGVLLDALPDEVVVSLDKLNQLENVIEAEHAAADRRVGIHKTAVWGMAGLACAVGLVYLAPHLPFIRH
jgi:hypothetical protein